MKKFTSTSLRFLGVVFLWMNLGHAPNLHAQIRKFEQDFATRTLIDAGNTVPRGIWSDDITMWVADDSDAKLYAYDLVTKVRDSTQDFNTLRTAGNKDPQGLWSDNTIIWVADELDDKLYAYNLATKDRDSTRDFNTLKDAGNADPQDLWSDGTTMWVADYSDGKIYAYNLATKDRDSTQDFNTLKDAGNKHPRGLWSDDITMWVGDYIDEKIYAYNLATKARDSARDFNTLQAAGNTYPRGIWSNDTIMWVVDLLDVGLYAYVLPNKTQTITFTFSEGVLDDTLDLSDIAVASSMLEVSYVSSDPSIAEVGMGMNAGKLILKALGNATITASQAGDDQYFAAPAVSHTITVSKNLQQTITFTFSEGVLDDTLDLSAIATASSMLEVSYVSSDPSIAEVGMGMNAGKLILKALGSVIITASQAGDARYLAATDVSHTITVSTILQQTITFTFSEGVLDDTLNLSDIATASSGLEVTYVSSNSDIAEVGMGMNEGKLILKALGNSTITASQAGNARYAVATEVTQVITVSKKDQTITFTLSSAGVLGDTLDLSATASSTLEVTYSSSDPSIAEVGTGTEEGKLILKAGGDAMITASQAGDAQYAVAPDVTHTITVSKKSQMITFTLPGTGLVDDTLDLSATASSGLEVNYVSSDPSIAEVGTGMNAGKLILKALGDIIITASQVGNDRYLAAPAVSHNITVRPITVRPKQDFTLDVKNNRPLGLWSNDTTMWVSDTGSNKLYAYNLATKARDSTRDFNTLIAAKNTSPRGLWSDGRTMWVANLGDAKLYAYNLATKARDAEKDFNTLQVARNTFPRGLWSNGTIMWVSDDNNDKLYAYNLATKVRDSTQDFNTLIAAGNTFLSGIWSDGRTMWVGDLNDAKIYAYNLATKDRDIAKDFEILNATGNTFPESIWSDGRTMWVGDNNKLYAYALPKKLQTITFTLSSTGMLGDTLDLSATASSMLEVSYVSSNPAIAEVGTGTEEGKLILKALGDATITASQAGDAQYLVATDVTQRITVNEKVLSVDVKNTDIRVWPNPVATQLNISSGSRSKLSITLHNLMGQKLQERELEGKGQMDLALVPAGVYLLHIRTAEETTSYLIYKE